MKPVYSSAHAGHSHRLRIHSRRRTSLASGLLLAVLSASACGDDVVTQPLPDAAVQPQTIADLIAADPRLGTLDQALAGSELATALAGPGSYTVFAPTDAAFDVFLAEQQLTREELLALAELPDYLGYHAISDELAAGAVAGQVSLTTIQGGEITVAVEEGEVILNGTIKLVEADIQADNGVLHVIDGVLVLPNPVTRKRFDRTVASPIVDREITTDSIVISDEGFVNDMQVMLDIEHSFVFDLIVTLTHVDTGATFRLVEQPRSGLDDIRVTLADTAATDIQDDVVFGFDDAPAYTEEQYRPIDPLEFTYGQPLAGEWMISVHDLRHNEEIGVLTAWSLDVTCTPRKPAPRLAVARPRVTPSVLAPAFSETVLLDARRLAGLRGDIEVTLSGGEGITAAPVILPEGENTAQVVFGAVVGATPGPRTLELTATSGTRSRTVEFSAEVVELDAQGVSLLAHVPLALLGAPGAQGNDIWGYTDPQTGTEYALVGTSVGTAFVDISRPEAPVYLGILPTHTEESLWRDIKVFANHAFIVSEAPGHGMQVFDLSQLAGVTTPQIFEATVHFGDFGNAHNIAINEETGFAYVIGATEGEFPGLCSGGLFMIDINDPVAPSYAGCFGGGVPAGQDPGPEYPTDVYVHDAQCLIYRGPDQQYRGREICISSDGNSATLGFADVTDKANPVQIARRTYDRAGYPHQGWLTEDHSYFLLNDEFDEFDGIHGTRTYVWDVRDLDDPILAGVYDNPRDAIGHNTYIRGNFAYQSNYTSGLRIVDMSGIDTMSLTEVAYFDTFPDDDAEDDPPTPLRGSRRCAGGSLRIPRLGMMSLLHHPEDGGIDQCGLASFQGAWSNYPYLASGVVIVSDIDRGLFIVRPDPL